METLAQVIDALMDSNEPGDLLNNPMIQFGTESRAYMGAELLPTRIVDQNVYKEEKLQYRTIVANDGTRYSPVQMKDGKRYGSFTVELADQDVGNDFTSFEHDLVLRYLRANSTMEAVTASLNWFNNTIVLPLEEKIEVHRWSAITDAVIHLRGDDGYREDILISNPAGHRITIASGSTAAPAGWYDPNRDPLEDLYKAQNLASDKGYNISRIITSTRNRNLLLRHPKVVARKNTVIFSGNQIQTVQGRLSNAELDAILSDDGLPGIETYNLKYNTSTGNARFLRETAFVMVATTGRDEVINDENADDGQIVLPNTLGYVGMGRPAGEGAPGRAWNMEMMRNKPRTIHAEAWQTTLPVIMDPEAIIVLNIPYQT